jgi:hypothetical protein
VPLVRPVTISGVIEGFCCHVLNYGRKTAILDKKVSNSGLFFGANDTESLISLCWSLFNNKRPSDELGRCSFDTLFPLSVILESEYFFIVCLLCILLLK